MNIPQNLKYYEEHDWIRIEADGIATIGITEFATENLGDVVFLELPEPGTHLIQFEKLGEVESVKAVSELYAPISGKVVARNDLVVDSPQVVNENPYENGWLIQLEPSNLEDLDNLMTPNQYKEFIRGDD